MKRQIAYFLVIFVGLREEVGGDWIIYDFNYYWLQEQNFTLFEYFLSLIN